MGDQHACEYATLSYFTWQHWPRRPEKRKKRWQPLTLTTPSSSHTGSIEERLMQQN